MHRVRAVTSEILGSHYTRPLAQGGAVVGIAASSDDVATHGDRRNVRYLRAPGGSGKRCRLNYPISARLPRFGQQLNGWVCRVRPAASRESDLVPCRIASPGCAGCVAGCCRRYSRGTSAPIRVRRHRYPSRRRPTREAEAAQITLSFAGGDFLLRLRNAIAGDGQATAHCTELELVGVGAAGLDTDQIGVISGAPGV